jgi:general secretion pathway protein N
MSSLAKLCVAGCWCVVATASALGIAHSAGLDVPLNVTGEQPAAQEAPVVKRTTSRTGNPLWRIPVEQLSATRERPIFSPSRRPPPTIAAEHDIVVPPAIQEPPSQEPPQLSLVGTVVNGDHGLAVFLEPSSTTPLRIRSGGEYQGWTLRLVQARSITLQKGENIAVLSLTSSATQPPLPVGTSIAQMPLTQTAPPLAEAGPPYLSPESRTLRMHQRQRSGRRQL